MHNHYLLTPVTRFLTVCLFLLGGFVRASGFVCEVQPLGARLPSLRFGLAGSEAQEDIRLAAPPAPQGDLYLVGRQRAHVTVHPEASFRFLSDVRYAPQSSSATWTLIPGCSGEFSLRCVSGNPGVLTLNGQPLRLGVPLMLHAGCKYVISHRSSSEVVAVPAQPDNLLVSMVRVAGGSLDVSVPLSTRLVGGPVGYDGGGKILQEPYGQAVICDGVLRYTLPASVDAGCTSIRLEYVSFNASGESTPAAVIITPRDGVSVRCLSAPLESLTSVSPSAGADTTFVRYAVSVNEEPVSGVVRLRLRLPAWMTMRLQPFPYVASVDVYSDSSFQSVRSHLQDVTSYESSFELPVTAGSTYYIGMRVQAVGPKAEGNAIILSAGSDEVCAPSVFINRNQAPEWLELPAMRLDETKTVQLDVSPLVKDDEPYGHLEFSCVNPGNGLTAQVIGTVLTITADHEAVTGTAPNKVFAIPLTVTDWLGGKATKTIGVTVNNINRGPVWKEELALTVAENGSGTLDLATKVQDADTGDILDIKVGASPSAAVAVSLSGKVLTVKPSYDAVTGTVENDQFQIPVTVTDSFGDKAESSVTLTVTNVNRAPRWTGNLALTVAEASEGQLDLSALVTEDDQDDPLTFQADVSGFPGVAVSLEGHALRVATTYDAVTGMAASKAFAIPVTVTDSFGDKAEGQVTLTVTHVNRAPAWTGSLALTVAEGSSGTLDLSTLGTDADDDELTYGVNAPAMEGVSIDLKGNLLQVKATYDAVTDDLQAVAYELPVTVSDGEAAEVRETVKLTVKATNRSPAWTGTMTVAMKENTTKTLKLSELVTDEDGDALTFGEVVVNEPGFTASLAGESLTLTADYDAVTTKEASKRFEIPVTVKDAQSTPISGTLVVTVINENRAPTWQGNLTLNLNETERKTVDLATLSEDLDGDEKLFGGGTLTATGFEASLSGSTVTVTATQDAVTTAEKTKTFTIPVTVRDAQSEESSANLTVTVTNVNRAPSWTDKGLAFEIKENASGELTLTSLVTDADRDDVTFASDGLAAAGLTVKLSGSRLIAMATYDAVTGADESVVYQIPVTVKDGQGGAVTAQVALTVKAVNRLPVWESAVALEVDEHASGSLELSKYVKDADGDTLTFGGGTLNETGVTAHLNSATLTVTTTYEAVVGKDTSKAFDIPVTVTDGRGGTVRKMVRLTVKAVNREPSWKTGLVMTLAEGASGTLNLADYVQELDKDELTFAGGALEATGFSSSLSGSTLTVKTTHEAVTTAEGTKTFDIPVTVTDGSGKEIPATVTVTVTHVNRVPTWTGNLALTVAEGETKQLVLSNLAEDLDADVLKFGMGTFDHPEAGVTLSGATLTVSPTKDAVSTQESAKVFTVPVTMTDGQGTSVPGTVTVTVTNVNRDPVWQEGLELALLENERGELDLTALASDADKDALTFVLEDCQLTGMTADVIAGILTVTTDYDAVSREEQEKVVKIPISVTDGHGQAVEAMVAVTVTDVNRLPVWDDTLMVAMKENEQSAIMLNERCQDLDGDALNFTLGEFSAEGVTVQMQGGNTLDIAVDYGVVPAGEPSKRFEIPLTVTDGRDKAVSEILILTVSNVNRGPAWTDTPVLTVAEGATESLNLLTLASDPDRDALQFHLKQQKLPGVTLTVEGTMLVASADYDALTGESKTVTHFIPLAVVDAVGERAETQLRLTVNATNRLPEWSGNLSLSVREGTTETLELSRQAMDPDGDSLVFGEGALEARGFVAGLSGSVLKVTASYEAVRTSEKTRQFRVPVTVRDADGVPVAGAVVVTVTNVNQAPSWTGNLAVSLDEGATKTVDLSRLATDLDGDSLSFGSGVVKQPGFEVRLSESLLTISTTQEAVTTAEKTKDFSIPVTVKDAQSNAVSGTLVVTVKNVNRLPVWAGGLALTVQENDQDTLELARYASDDDADSLTFTVEPLSATGMKVSLAGSQLTVSATYDAVGKDSVSVTYPLTVTVKDGQGGSVSTQVSLTVEDVNRVPVWNEVLALTVEEGKEGTLDLSRLGEDADGDTLTFGGGNQAAEGLTSSLVGSTLTVLAGYDAVSAQEGTKTFSIPVTVTDSRSTPVSSAVTVTVKHVNRDPSWQQDGLALTVSEGNTGTLDLADWVQDLDLDTLSYSGGELSALGITSSLSGSMLMVTTTHEAVTTAEKTKAVDIAVSVSDGSDKAISGTVRVTVTNVNQLPTWTGALHLTVEEGATANLDLAQVSEDLDGDALTFELGNYENAVLPARMSGTTLIVSPTKDAVSTDEASKIFQIPVTMKDQDGKPVSGTVTVTVTNVNRAPVWLEGLELALDENSQAELDLTSLATDGDQDALTFDVGTVDAAGVTVDIQQGTLIVTATYDTVTREEQSKVIDVPVSVTDHHGEPVMAKVSVTVTDVNRIPAWDDNLRIAMQEDESVVLDLREKAQDLDADELSFSLGAFDEPNVTVTLQDDHSLAIAVGFDVVPAGERLKRLEIPLTVSDGRGEDVTGMMILTVSDVNRAPAWTGDMVMAVSEGATGRLNLQQLVTDLDGDELFFEVGSLTIQGVKVSQEGSMLVVSADYDALTGESQQATYGIPVTVSDALGEVARGEIALTVNATNRVPVWTGALTVTVAENGESRLDLSRLSEDSDGHALSYGVGSFNEPGLSARLVGSTLIIAATYDVLTGDVRRGKYWIPVTVSDGIGAPVDGQVLVTVTATNRLPSWSSSMALEVREGESAQLDLSRLASDADGDDKLAIRVEPTSLPGMTVRQSGDVLKVSATYDAVTGKASSATHDISVVATDGFGASARGTVRVTVTNVNRAPEWAEGLALMVDENETGRLDLSRLATDPDGGDELRFGVGASPSEAVSVSLAGSTLQVTPSYDAVSGTAPVAFQIPVTVTDREGLESQGVVTVLVTNVNRAPSWQTGMSLTVSEQVPAELDLLSLCQDPDQSDQLSVTVGMSPSEAIQVSLSGSRLKVMASYEAVTGSSVTSKNFQLPVTVTDSLGASASGVLDLTVENVNRPPTWKDGLGLAVNETERGSLDLSGMVSDPDDGDRLTVKVGDSPSAAVTVLLSGKSLLVSASHDAVIGTASTQTFRIPVTATDSFGDKAESSVTLTVTNVNRAPRWTGHLALTVAEASEGQLNLAELVTEDDQDDPLTFQADTSGFPGVTVSREGQTLKVAATYDAVTGTAGSRTFDIPVTVRDSFGGKADGHVTLTVTKVNRVPVIRQPSVVVEETDEIDLRRLFRDDDGDDLNYRIVELTSGQLVDRDQIPVDMDKEEWLGTERCQLHFVRGTDWQPVSFRVQAKDSWGALAASSVQVTVTVHPRCLARDLWGGMGPEGAMQWSDLQRGWNLLAVPFELVNFQKFMDWLAPASLWTWDHETYRYVQATSLSFNEGFWVYLETVPKTDFELEGLLGAAVPERPGWTLMSLEHALRLGGHGFLYEAKPQVLTVIHDDACHWLGAWRYVRPARVRPAN